jgi:elongation factor Ts
MNTEQIIKLRQLTGAGMVDCQKALAEAADNFELAIDILRKKGEVKAAKKLQERVTKEGIVYSYIHSNNKAGAMLELDSETDFVSRGDDFRALAHDLAMHITAAAPEYLRPEDVPAEVIAKEKEIYREQLKAEGKPEAIMEKILEGKLAKYFEEVCLLKQPFIKDDSIRVEEYINRLIAKTGEKIEVKRFVRYSF